MFTKGILMASFFVVCAGAAEYRFEVSGGGMGTGNWAVTVFDSSNVVPAEPSAPPGYEITYPAPAGTDSVTWRNRRSGLFGRTCLSCSSSVLLPWLAKALAASPIIPNNAHVLDTVQVTFEGAPRNYIRASRSEDGWGTTQTTFLVGVGMVFHSESQNMMSSQSHWHSQLRLLEYNGINIDTLWGNVLPHPTPIHAAGAGLRQVLPTHAPRRFSPDEMGVFLGRTSALDRDKPLPTRAK